MMVKNPAINSYRQAASSEAMYATPFRLVQMLMTGALDGMANARGSIIRKEHEARNNEIKWVISVIDALRGALDFEQGGEIANNLDMLYDYMIRRLFTANVEQDVDALDEVISLLKEIKTAWDAMPEVIQNASNIKDVVRDL
ncbi:MAG: flagellar export chaperone FliS [Candidatus Thiodiazotropha sp. (ex. Lucinisca nassula)]|uniref:Flagellar secretion chaperone FliS n=1 Tax=Candidatus Thiodiazotropha lotti TaxID=2792787 RepID=A0A9E4K6W9_9GAMM|nr:flagellar export chaperone FliS [Candidatus Thiodiazotropha endoloripes]MBV2091939.1 flagellar export chaperone FliS [Candidatus Thiodiazotropha taylori]MBW9257682.1 flagellar export chaperone FliS [Candidatus Thiodiazotropha sp. (ex. Lucinisca nassula)]MCG7872278.1 flagellar export chaperone FliS [Candidatus Thiodiazotropha lotti]MCG7900794.1 flagellar export chaperone FliS [Candidatus Thiodiazotropha weberae]MBW9260295.1 flagellar export chaperone FliS [Candidatus Thiodiazotropha sp. (ex.